MSRSIRNVLLACAALMLGCILYVCFRSTTYVAVFFRRIPLINLLCQFIQPYSNAVLSFYFTDFLWAFSFCCLLNAIHVPGIKGTILCGGATFFAGVIWEVLQYMHVVTGTCDALDMLTYLLAALLSTTINLGGRS